MRRYLLFHKHFEFLLGNYFDDIGALGILCTNQPAFRVGAFPDYLYLSVSFQHPPSVDRKYRLLYPLRQFLLNLHLLYRIPMNIQLKGHQPSIRVFIQLKSIKVDEGVVDRVEVLAHGLFEPSQVIPCCCVAAETGCVDLAEVED
jgi:hypothetical protein